MLAAYRQRTRDPYRDQMLRRVIGRTPLGFAVFLGCVALSTLFLIRPMIGPYTVCATFEEAMTFGQNEFRKRGLRLSPAIRNPWPDFTRR